ncbi:MAG: multiple monosaccharide ABC transporter substrate-binding protein [Bacillota bacterium]|jgi:putative multiple sugar transport system substrate-binding protein|nr:sugar ABC transporter substrate-binding protein [Bacillota bacterium]HOB90944.1 sugar ABC transporter substrate-binding protein [Bacillota bacterium]HPZ55008.1 sugar ABC transporter substrate-binding protein [Bacillota bacterium]HQD17973.1 sugar ABC transporter substrate-binding protein [Bacillota bacterium]
MKKYLVVLLLVMALAIPSAALAQVRIGVAMPTQSLQRWNQDGANMKMMLEAAGYVVDLQYANNDVALQVAQIENMILNGADILVISAIDGSSLGTVLAIAKEEGIPVIAYDRLIMETDAVSYYATFDNYKVGQLQGEYLVQALGLETLEGSVNMEIVAGSPDDNNARYFYQGAIDVLMPYIESGKVRVPSGQIAFEAVATLAWSSERAQARMDNLIASNYSDGTPLHAVLCSNDSTALGVTNSLVGAGFEKMPYITGQDCDIANTKNIIAGLQSMSIFKDTRTLAARVVQMIESIVKGEEPEVNDTTTYFNGVFVVPTYLCTPVFADINNYKELLIDSGYYTPEQLGL